MEEGFCHQVVGLQHGRPTFVAPTRPLAKVKKIRMVSAIPACSKSETDAVDASIPFDPMPASVRPRCKA